MNDATAHAEARAADPEGEVAITLGVLSAIEANSAHSQRSLAAELGIALGLANAYLKRCVRKGLVKVQQVPANRYAYFLTPQGFAEKARLTGDYLTHSLGYFRRARQQSSEIFESAAHRGFRRLALIGASDLAEIVALSALDTNIELIGIVDAKMAGRHLAGLRIFKATSELSPFDAVVITDMTDPSSSYRKAVAELDRSRVFVLPLLRVKTSPAVAEVFP